MSLRIGQGVDVHAFDQASDRMLRLGGVDIPDGPALSGHSDADAVLHAIVDALLGAAAAGDIGTLVGVDLAETTDADSAEFVKLACARIAGLGFAISNVDVTIIAQRPRIGPFRTQIADRVADILGVGRDRVSIKATTTDRLGFIGRSEGIACLAVASLIESADD